MAKRFVAKLPRKQILRAGSELSTRVLRKVSSAMLFSLTSRLRRASYARPIKCQGLHRDRLGHLFIKCFLLIWGSPKVSVLDSWNEGRGKRGTLTLVKEVPSFRKGRWSGRADAHCPSHKAVPTFAIVLSQD